LADPGANVRSTVEWDQADLMNHLVKNRDVLSRLNDVVVVVVTGGERRNAVIENAALVKVPVLP
jgi:hypothetical protein